jgi:predicted transcriptional regulator
MVEIEEPTREFIIRDVRKPVKKDLKTDIEWFCKCMGFMEPRDKERTAIAIFREILKAAKSGRRLTSKYLIDELKLSRGIVVYYLNKFVKAGVMRHVGNEYELRERNLEGTVDEIEKDILRVISNIRDVAVEIDERMKLQKRR